MTTVETEPVLSHQTLRSAVSTRPRPPQPSALRPR